MASSNKAILQQSLSCEGLEYLLRRQKTPHFYGVYDSNAKVPDHVLKKKDFCVILKIAPEKEDSRPNFISFFAKDLRCWYVDVSGKVGIPAEVKDIFDRTEHEVVETCLLVNPNPATCPSAWLSCYYVLQYEKRYFASPPTRGSVGKPFLIDVMTIVDSITHGFDVVKALNYVTNNTFFDAFQ